MNDYQIVVGSTTDLPVGVAKKSELEVIPFIVTLDGKDYYNYLDNRELTPQQFYDALRNGRTSTTTQVTAHRYMEVWEPILKSGRDVLYICLSSALSKSYEQACLAAQELGSEYPDRQIITIDSKSACLGQGALAVYASNAKKQGRSIVEVAEMVERLIPRLQHWVIADDLHYLKRGGRLSSTAATIGSLLNVKPVLTVLSDGSLVPKAKARGQKAAFKHIVDEMVKQKVKVNEQTICIAHSDSPDGAKQLQDMIIARFGPCHFVVSEIGPVIGTHAGPGTIACFFLGAKRWDK
ncbi:MAG: DegV family protein [Defluviitaleaceae bacterium]|nr:DegV family protein [Defluviitaleaceae bacterium]